MKPLKEATSEKHKIAENMPFNSRMLKGKLNEEEYLLYLNQQIEIFQTIEKIGIPSPSLTRVTYIKEDIDELKDKGYSYNIILKATKNYTTYLSSLNYEQILPHVYLNYLAIMFGGQFVKKKVPSSGKMYDFENIEEAMQSIKKIQKDEWKDEVNKGYDFIIEIFKDLENKILLSA